MDALPQEMVDHIGCQCDKASLLSLRLANKKLAAALRSTFIERYIQKRTHLYSIYGLQKLVDLTAERDLAKHINEIVLVVQSRHLDYNPDHTLTEGYEYQLCQSETAWLDIEEYGGSRGKHLIRSVLRNLQDAASSVTFAFSESYRSSHSYGLGIRQQQAGVAGLARLNVQPDRRTEVDCEGIVKALLKASEGRPVPIWHLDICHNVQDRSFASIPSPFEGFKPGLASTKWSMLRSLKLYIGYGIGLWNETPCWEGLDRFVTAVPNLEHVALAWESLVIGSELNEILEGMGNVFGRVHVKHIELGPFCTTRRALIKFLCSQMGSLESVKLMGVALRRGKGWRRALKAVAERTTVAKIELDRVWMGELTDWREKYYMVMDEQGSHHLVQEGGEAVKKRLVELASNATFTDKLGAKLNLTDETESEDEEGFLRLKGNNKHHTPKSNTKGLRTIVIENSMDHAHTLGAMPSELIIIIGECCDRTSLLHLRLVSTKFYDATGLTFLDRHIRKRTHAYTNYGLQALVDLTSNMRLVKHIKEIELVTEYLHSAPLDYQQAYLDVTANAETSLIAESNVGRDRLQTIMQNLNDASSLVNFSLSWTDVTAHPYGRTERRNRMDQPGIIEIEDSKTHREAKCNDLLRSLLHASAVILAPVLQLNICYDRIGGNQLEDVWVDFVHKAPGMLDVQGEPSWIHLHKLQLDLGHLDHWQLAWEGLELMFSAAPNMVSLALSGFSQLEGQDDALAKITPMLASWHKIRYFELSECTPEGTSLVGLLLSQAQHLEGIKFRAIGLRPEGSWHETLGTMAKALKLSSLELSLLDREDGYYWKSLCFEKKIIEDFVLEGGVVNQQGLLKIAKDATYCDDQ
ncbi:hypothetical protein LTR97_009309 [Elasticomyces elasticus]|uniref:F-box domain-containing protein n=1 Tax=Elasticomyces elasticus TaxID=574655 RepID=A0AAN7W095_9PEZI|nr:hypothetical protein LTR97_009309 [Elasticomyces elasticus]